MRTTKTGIVILVSIVFFQISVQADWLRWRGPNGDGTLQNQGETYPVSWSENENVAWKTPLSDPGNSSPVSNATLVYLTQSSEKGRVRSLLGFSFSNGELLWKKDVAYPDNELTHKTNQWSSATPTIDDGIFTWHGSAGYYVYDLDGKPLMAESDLGVYSHQWGANAASPVVHQDKVYIHAGPGARALLFCLDKKTGKTLWEKNLPTSALKEFKGSWSTPVIRENGSRTEVIVAVTGSVRAFDATSGDELWRCSGLGDLCYTDPMISGDGHLVYMCGYGGPAIGMRLPEEGQGGDITESHRLWIYPPDGKGRKNPQRIGTGQIVGNFIYMVNEPGIAECVELKTGKQVWKERFTKRTWSSLNLVNDYFYIIDQTATTYVFKANPEGLEKLHVNQLGGNQMTNATLAFVNGAILIRTHSNLYCIKNL